MQTTNNIEPLKIIYKGCKYLHIHESFIEWESSGEYEREEENELMGLMTKNTVNYCHEALVLKKSITKLEKNYDSTAEENPFNVMIFMGHYGISFDTDDVFQAESLYVTLRDWIK